MEQEQTAKETLQTNEAAAPTSTQRQTTAQPRPLSRRCRRDCHRLANLE